MSWALIWRGIFAVVFGCVAIFWSGITMAALIIWFGAFTFLSGIFTCIASVQAARHHTQWGLLLVSGLLSIVVGVLALISPGQMAVAMVWVLGAWAIMTGVFELATALTSTWAGGKRWLLVGTGIVSVALGCLLIGNPLAGAISLVWLLGGYALLIGMLFIFMGTQFRKIR